MEQDSQDQEYEVYGVKVYIDALVDEEPYHVDDTCKYDDVGEDSALLHLFCRSCSFGDLLYLLSIY